MCRGCRRGPRTVTSGSKRRARSEYDGDQLAVLTTEFNTCQYLTGQRCAQLAAGLSLTESQVKVWFQNRRAKTKKERRSQRVDIATVHLVSDVTVTSVNGQEHQRQPLSVRTSYRGW